MILPCFVEKWSSIVAEEGEVRQIAEIAVLGNRFGYFLKVAGEVVEVDNNSQSPIHSCRFWS